MADEKWVMIKDAVPTIVVSTAIVLSYALIVRILFTPKEK